MAVVVILMGCRDVLCCLTVDTNVLSCLAAGRYRSSLFLSTSSRHLQGKLSLNFIPGATLEPEISKTCHLACPNHITSPQTCGRTVELGQLFRARPGSVLLLTCSATSFDVVIEPQDPVSLPRPPRAPRACRRGEDRSKELVAHLASLFQLHRSRRVTSDMQCHAPHTHQLRCRLACF